MLAVLQALGATILVVALVGTCVRAQQQHQQSELTDEQQITPPSEPESVWEYEPRVWTPDEIITNDDPEVWQDIKPTGPEQQVQEPEGFNLPGWTRSGNFERRRNEPVSPPRASLRNKTHFYEPKFGPLFRRSPRANSTNPNVMNRSHLDRQQQQPQQQEQPEKCDQFRVDIQETVICDRQRCEKLDFEWPKHDNQMIVVQTTKHGMRFYQAHLEFKPPVSARVQSPSNRVKFTETTTTTTAAPSNGTSSPAANPKMPIKFDILDLFKPKPSSTTPAPPWTGAVISPVTSPRPIRDITEPRDNNRTEFVTTFRIDTRRRMQKIMGFGGALSDSTCRNIKSLSPTMSKSLMEDYFGPRGLQYTFVRMSMGSSDFSLTPYTNNDKPYEGSKGGGSGGGGSGGGGNGGEQQIKRQAYDEADDVEMKYFHLTDEDFEYKLPVARQAIATSRRELKFFSSLWSPPTWMKNNSHIVHGYLKGDVYGPYYKALADLIVRWLEAYRRQGIEFWGTTGLNEPITGIKPFIFHNSLGITRDDYITWIKLYLGPMLRQRGFQNLKLIPVDDNRGYMPNWAVKLLADNETAKYVSGISLHWYMNDDYENLNVLIDKHPDKFLLSTEACNGYYPFQVHVLPGDWDRGMAYMLDIMRLLHKNVVGWVDWNMVLTVNGGPSWPGNYIDAAVLVNAERDEYYKSPAFYALGHYSRFVVPDSYRLDHRLANAKYDYPLEASGFYTPNDYVVIVVANANRHEVPFKVIVDKQLVRVVDLKAESFNTIVFKWKKKS